VVFASKVSSPGKMWGESATGHVAGENIGVPVRIRIPSIGLDAAIEKVALTADGFMDVPVDPLNTGWYELGPRPGETGSATISGHVNWINNPVAVFADLHNVKSGDRIIVQDDNGAFISFVVREIRSYDAEADAVDVFTSNDGKAHLNLITCDGVWDKVAKSYSQRLVIFTDKE
jgi:LPXTG-site transpeptidase (sortase) family protein